MKINYIDTKSFVGGHLVEGVHLDEKNQLNIDFDVDRRNDVIKFFGEQSLYKDPGAPIYYGYEFVSEDEQIAAIKQQKEQLKSSLPTKSVNALKNAIGKIIHGPVFRDNSLDQVGGNILANGITMKLNELRDIINKNIPKFGEELGQLVSPAFVNEVLQMVQSAADGQKEGTLAAIYGDKIDELYPVAAIKQHKANLAAHLRDAEQQFRRVASKIISAVGSRRKKPSPDILAFVQFSAQRFVNNLPIIPDTITYPQSSSTLPELLATSIQQLMTREGAMVDVNQAFAKPSTYGQSGLYFDVQAYGKRLPKGPQTVIGRGLTLQDVMDDPKKFSIKRVYPPYRQFFRNTQVVGDEWVNQYAKDKSVLVVDDASYTGTTVLSLLKSLKSAEELAAYIMIKA